MNWQQKVKANRSLKRKNWAARESNKQISILTLDYQVTLSFIAASVVARLVVLKLAGCKSSERVNVWPIISNFLLAQ